METKNRFVKFKAAVDASDHACFYRHGIPILYFTTGLPPRYHTSKDELSYINFEGMAFLHEYVLALLKQMHGQKISYKAWHERDVSKVSWYFLKEMMKSAVY